MKHVLQTNLDLDTSKQIAEQAFKKYEQRLAKYDPTIQWTDDRHAALHFRAKGFDVNGTIELQPGAVEIDLDVPFIFRPFRGTAIRILDEEMQKLLAEHQASAGTASNVHHV